MKFLNKNIKINVVLILGLLLIFIGVLLLTGYFAKNPQSIFSFRGVILFLLGAFILFIELMNPSKTWLMFISSVLMLISLVIGMIDVGFLPYAVKNIWPCFVIIFGLGLILFSIYKTKKIKAVYRYHKNKFCFYCGKIMASFVCFLWTCVSCNIFYSKSQSSKTR